MARQYGKITDEELERMRGMIGVEITKSSMHQLGDFTVTEELVHRFATGIADMNPLYVDQEYARKSKYGTLIAPPGMLMRAERINGGTHGFPGCHGIWRSATLEWRRPIRVGDVLRGKGVLDSVYEVAGRFAGGRAVNKEMSNYVLDKSGEEIGAFKRTDLQFERGSAKQASKYGTVALAKYSPDDLERIKADYAKVVRCGATPRYWEDVKEGEEIPFVIKGPTTLTSKVAFESVNRGWPGGWVVGHELALELFRKHPGLPIINQQGIPEPPLSIHWTNENSQYHLGLPGAYDTGYERINWTIQMLTSWAGDDSFLKRLHVRFGVFNLLGDTTWVRGTVKRKFTDQQEHLVECDVVNVNQRGHTVTEGTAVVVLPSRRPSSNSQR